MDPATDEEPTGQGRRALAHVARDVAREVVRVAGRTAAGIVYTHREKLIATLELLAERASLSKEQVQRLLATYEASDPDQREAIEQVVGGWAKSSLGDAILEFGQDEASMDAGDTALEARERPSEDVVAELVRYGRDVLAQPGTREVERTFYHWAVDTISAAEHILIRVVVGTGVILLVAGGLWFANQQRALEELVNYAVGFLLLLLGLVLVIYSSRISEWGAQSRSELSEFFESRPSRRLERLLGISAGPRHGPDDEPDAEADDDDPAATPGFPADPPIAK